jgi:predicted permease
MDAFIQDLRYAVRQIGRAPGFASVAALTLAIGIGANTALFSMLDAILSRPLPGVRDASELVWVAPVRSQSGRALSMSYPDYKDYHDQTGVFSELATMSDAQFALAIGGNAERVRGQFVSGNFFTTLRTPLALGRGFTADEDDSAGDPRVVVVSHRLWEERFRRRPDVIGSRVTVNGQPFRVVGVAPERFNGVDHGEPRLLWVPMAARPLILNIDSNILSQRNSWWLVAVGRLASGVSPQSADAALRNVAASISRADSSGHGGITARTFPLRGGLAPNDGADVTPVAMLAAIVTFIVLLIACANVSNLLLGRSVARRREIAARLSLGASRGRVVMQLLIESALLAIIATAIGLLLARWSTDIMASIIPAPLDVSINGKMLAFTVIAAAATTLLFGLLPAMTATRSDVMSALKDTSPGADPRRSRLQNSFVVAQVSLSLVLLVTAGLFLSSAYKATRINVGFDASTRVLAVGFDLGLQGYTPPRATAFIDGLRERAASLPGVESVSFTNVVPMGDRLIGGDVAIETPQGLDSTRFSEAGGMEVYQNTIRPDLFATLGIPVVRGRDFNTNDVANGTPVTIVSQRIAERAWPGEDPIGKRIRTNGAMHTVVGVAGEAMTSGVRERQRPTVYVAQRQNPGAMDLTLLVRARSDASLLAATLRREIRALDGNLPVFGVQTLAEYRSGRMSEARIGSTLLVIFGGLALLLAAVGIYAVMAFSVGQRTREIGVRVALGAVERQVVGMFVRRGLRVTAIGACVGLGLAVTMAKVLSSAFLGIAATDVIPFVAVTALLLGVAAAATFLAARQAARIDPMTALRAE